MENDSRAFNPEWYVRGVAKKHYQIALEKTGSIHYAEYRYLFALNSGLRDIAHIRENGMETETELRRAYNPRTLQFFPVRPAAWRTPSGGWIPGPGTGTEYMRDELLRIAECVEEARAGRKAPEKLARRARLAADMAHSFLWVFRERLDGERWDAFISREERREMFAFAAETLNAYAAGPTPHHTRECGRETAARRGLKTA